jgi:hypothetical protein
MIVVSYADINQFPSLYLLECLKYVILRCPSPLLNMFPLPVHQLTTLVHPVKLLLCPSLLPDQVVFRALLGTHQSLNGKRLLTFQ